MAGTDDRGIGGYATEPTPAWQQREAEESAARAELMANPRFTGAMSAAGEAATDFGSAMLDETYGPVVNAVQGGWNVGTAAVDYYNGDTAGGNLAASN